MGSPRSEEGHGYNEKKHEVILTEGFWLSTYEITQEQWKRVVRYNPSFHRGNGRLPVENVSWEFVQKFIKRLNRQAVAGRYRLPTEAEWEYAYRAGTQTRFYWGDDPLETEIGDYAWCSPEFEPFADTHPVGSKLPNAWGLYDMSGNVSEWCHDYYSSSYTDDPDWTPDSVVDPTGPAYATFQGYEVRVYRNGSVFYAPIVHRAAYRGIGISILPASDIGFRLVRIED